MKYNVTILDYKTITYKSQGGGVKTSDPGLVLVDAFEEVDDIKYVIDGVRINIIIKDGMQIIVPEKYLLYVTPADGDIDK